MTLTRMTLTRMSLWTVATVVAFGSTAAASQAVAPRDDVDEIVVDPKLKPYERVSGVSGNLNSIGSDTLNNLMTLWAEGFKKRYPNVRIQIEGKGSSTAPPSLIAGTAQVGPMSRAMKSTEIDEFEKAFGYKPLGVAVAIDALAVYVHKDNPIEKLTMAQVDAIFSENRKLNFATDIATWGDLELGGEFARRPISLYGRNSASGTYGYFKKVALGKGDYKTTVKEQPGSASVVQSVESDKFGIGYSGIGYRTSGVKTLALAKKAGGDYGDTSVGSVLSGKYPLARQLFVYFNKPPNEALDPLTREFLRFVLSKDGQEVVKKDGYIPMPSKLAEKELGKL